MIISLLEPAQQQDTLQSYHQVRQDFNKSYTYFFPLIGLNKNNFQNIRACFVGDTEKPEYNNHVFLLHYSRPDPASISYENQLMKHPQFVTVYYPDNHSIMFVFSVPEGFTDDYNLLMKSKFSWTSIKYKEQVIRFHSPYETNIKQMLFYKILTRSKKLRLQLEDNLSVSIPPDAELCNCLDMNIEVFQTWMKIPD